MKIDFFNTFIHPTAEAEVAKVLRTTFLSEGALVKSFEEQLSHSLGLRNCVTINSGTSALHLALALAGVGAGDEVIIPAQTFVATGLVVILQNAKPVFADIDYATGNISTKSISDKITSRTKAIIPVHWGGYPCDLKEINAIAAANNIAVIEDAAHALGAQYQQLPIGGISDYTCFSFQAIKHLTTGDGGAISINDKNKYDEAVTKRWFGINRHAAPMGTLGERNYNIDQLGYKYHLNNYAAALGIANLNGFDDRLKRRISIASQYRSALTNVPGIQLFDAMPDRQSSFWLFGFHVERRDDFIRRLKEHGIPASVVHQRIDRNDIFGGLNDDLESQRRFDETQIHIPIHDAIDTATASFITDTIRKGW